MDPSEASKNGPDPSPDVASRWARLRGLYEVSAKPSRLLAMEGVRGLAVLLVFFVHFHAIFSPYLSGKSLLFAVSEVLGMVGNSGVDLFFVISGYLIYGALIRRPTNYAKFLRRRVERIYPTFLAVLGLYLTASIIFRQVNKLHGSPASVALYLLENFLLLPGIFSIPPVITVAWSLSYEFFFYVSIPIVVCATRMRGWPRAARILLFLTLGLFYVGYSFTVPRSQVRLLMFISGILLYEALDSDRFKGRLRGRGEAGALFLFVASLAFVYLLDKHLSVLSLLPGLGAGNTILPGITTYQGPYKVIALGVSCFFFTLYCFGRNGLLKRLFSWNPMRYLGNMSYSYYLLHGATLKALSLVAFAILPPSGHSPVVFCAALPVGFAATWITSTVLFAVVEKPISLERRTHTSRATPVEASVTGETACPVSTEASKGA